MKDFPDTHEGWSEAFDYVRENDKPMLVKIGGDAIWKLYPSGTAIHVRDLDTKDEEVRSS